MKTTTAIKSFNILDPSVRLHRHYLLEASAGTGKTFTIENMVMRLLAGNEEEPPIPLEEILVVTFTRAATRELIQRIQSKIQDAINDPPASIPSSPKVQENLKTALANFDEAQIFTIHGFCARMLMEYGMDADFGGERIAIDEGLSTGKTQEMVKDFFRSKLRPERYSATQVDAVLRDCHGDIERMISRLERLAQSPLEIEALPSHEESFVFFKEILEGIHASFRFSFDELQGDLLKHLRQFKKTSNRQGELLDEVSRALDVISKLFIKFEYSLEDFEIFLNEGYFLFSLMQEGLRKSRGKILSDAELNYPGLLQVLQNDLFPLLRVSRGTLETIARMGRDCQELLSTVSYEEELFSPDALLASMEKALSNPKFCESIRKRFRFAIIDEFQDTDPTQWKVFSKLFHEEPGQYLYLVGDPKQSIYAFRNADIYTYLNAAKTIGNDLHATLDSNYRSTPELIKALNILFDEETSPHWIPLPRIESRLPYKAVKVPPQPKSEKEFKDNRGAIHFFISSGKGGRTQQWPSDNLEDSQLFPSISNEIISLHKNEDLAFKEIAILVRDRYQLERLSRYLQQRGIPSAARRKSTILDTSIPAEWKVIIQAILNPRDIKMILTALSTRLIAWDYQKIKQFRSQLSSDPFTCEPVIAKFHQLRQLLFKEGFHASFQEFMNSKWLDDKLSVEERLLSTDHYGDAFYTDCYHFAELLSQYQSDHCVQGEGLLHFFTQLSRWQADDDSCIRLRRDSSRDAVTIMTLHMSKGLEYGVVFCFFVTKRV
jgi:exodeoxyribonuclease V beta subunit